MVVNAESEIIFRVSRICLLIKIEVELASCSINFIINANNDSSCLMFVCPNY